MDNVTPPKSELHRSIWSFTWPMMLSNLSTPLLGLVDTAILGHLGDPSYLAAVGVGSGLITLLYWAFSFLRMGTTGLTAQAYGAANPDLAAHILLRSLCMALTIGLLISSVGQWLLPIGAAIVGEKPEIVGLASDYGAIRLYSAPAALMTYAIVGWLLGQQQPKLPLIIMVITNLANVALDYLFILHFDMKSDGAALASVCAEYLGLSIALGCLLLVHRRVFAQWRDAALDKWSSYQQILRVNGHLFLRTITLMLCLLFFTAQGARQGEEMLAANTILMNLLLAMAYGLDGIANAAEALVGQSVGRRRQKEFYRVCLGCTQWAAVLALGFALVFALGKPLITSLFTNISTVEELVGIYYNWLVLLPLVAVWCYLLDGIFIGSGHTRAMRDTMLIASIFVYLPIWYFTQSLGNHGLWLAFLSWKLARGVGLAVIFWHNSRCHKWWPAT
ncbi:MAG: MATE family efflux transporter [Pseudomonadales bacterium]